MAERAKFITSTFRSILMATMTLLLLRRVSVHLRQPAKNKTFLYHFKNIFFIVNFLNYILIPLENRVREIHSFIGRRQGLLDIFLTGNIIFQGWWGRYARL